MSLIGLMGSMTPINQTSTTSTTSPQHPNSQHPRHRILKPLRQFGYCFTFILAVRGEMFAKVYKFRHFDRGLPAAADFALAECFEFQPSQNIQKTLLGWVF